MKKILIDNGHGHQTPGKKSPDGKLREYLYTRQIAAKVVEELRRRGYDAEQLVAELDDVALSQRASRVNSFCKRLGAKNVILVSIHCNASPPNDGKWHNARGWEVYTSKGKTRADNLADRLFEAAKKHLPSTTKFRTDYSDGDADKEAGFAILTKTQCAAALTENLFQDNRDDVDFLLSEEGRRAIINLHVEGILSYLASSNQA